MSKTVKILKQIDEEEIPKAFSKIRKNANSPEAVKRIVDDIVEKTEVSHPAGKALLSNYTNSMLLGEAAFDEMPEVVLATPAQRASALKNASYSGLNELRDSIRSEKLNYPAFGNVVKISPEYNPEFWGKSNRSGILLSQPPDVPMNFLTGVNLHEYGHQYDDAIRLAVRKMKQLQSLDSKDPDVIKEYNRTKNALSVMLKKYPDIEETIKDKDLLDFESKPYDWDKPKIANIEKGIESPSELAKELTSGHMFKRNYEFDNLMKALKGGLKAVKGLGVGMIPAAAAGAVAAYSPDSVAGEAAKTALKVTDEGDPLSLLMPLAANEGEEAEVQKMVQKQKTKQIPGATDSKWYGRKWSKIKNLLEK
jgi:hypothetical protein